MKKIVVPTFYECLSLQVPFLFRLNIRHTRRISLFPGYLMHVWLTTINPIAPWGECVCVCVPPLPRTLTGQGGTYKLGQAWLRPIKSFKSQAFFGGL